LSPRKIAAKYVVMHYTVGVGDGLIKLYADPKLNASQHVVIRRDGSVVQYLPIDYRALHVGSASWGSLASMNGHSIGVSLENWGELKRSGSEWKTVYGRTVPADEVVEAQHKQGGGAMAWHAFTRAQIETTKLLLKSIVAANPEVIDVIGHDDLSSRKLDPGPVFPMEEVREAVFGRRDALPPPE